MFFNNSRLQHFFLWKWGKLVFFWNRRSQELFVPCAKEGLEKNGTWCSQRRKLLWAKLGRVLQLVISQLPFEITIIIIFYFLLYWENLSNSNLIYWFPIWFCFICHIPFFHFHIGLCRYRCICSRHCVYRMLLGLVPIISIVCLCFNDCFVFVFFKSKSSAVLKLGRKKKRHSPWPRI